MDPVKKVLSKVVLLGDMGVGKTTLLSAYTGNAGKSGASMGPDFKKKDLKIGNVDVNLQIWDTAGQEQFQALGFSYYRGANCCVLVFSVADRKSFESLSMWRK